MSRGYGDGDCDSNIGFLWHTIVNRATRGERGQKLLGDLCKALDEMPVKELVADELEEDGGVCALGALGHARGIDMRSIDANDYDRIAQTFGCAYTLAREIMNENDEGGRSSETPAQRWERMRAWVAKQIVVECPREKP
jgi:hypothetical protein